MHGVHLRAQPGHLFNIWLICNATPLFYAYNNILNNYSSAQGRMLGWTPQPPVVDDDAEGEEEDMHHGQQGQPFSHAAGFPRGAPQTDTATIHAQQHSHNSTLAQVTVLAHALVGLVAQCGYRCDTYALGHVAHAVGMGVWSGCRHFQ